jgi:transposase InsO family protein
MQAYKVRNPDKGLIFHTDRGSNYRSHTFCKCLILLGVEQSLSRSSMPYDNAVAESFFASMKKEELYRRKYRSEKEFRQAVDDYMLFYNTKRPHQTLKYKTPEQAEAAFARSHGHSEAQ